MIEKSKMTIKFNLYSMVYSIYIMIKIMFVLYIKYLSIYINKRYYVGRGFY